MTRSAFLLYSKFTSPTGRLLKESLGIEGGTKPPKTLPQLLLRWGCSAYGDVDDEIIAKSGLVYNQAERLCRVSNRQYMFQDMARGICEGMLAHHSGIAPVATTSGVTLLRHRFSKWGSDIIATTNHDDKFWDQNFTLPKWGGYFAVEYWPGDYEVRCHIVEGRSVLFQYKALREGAEPPKDPLVVVRNSKNGWGLYPLNNEKARELGIRKSPLREKAKQVLELFKLQYGVVDFLVRSGGEYRVLEVNTAPGLEEASVAKWSAALKSIIEETVVEEEARDPEPPVVTPEPAPVMAAFNFGGSTARPRPRPPLPFYTW
jgi:hypothetical protein